MSGNSTTPVGRLWCSCCTPVVVFVLHSSFGVHAALQLWCSCCTPVLVFMLHSSCGVHVALQLWCSCSTLVLVFMLHSSCGVHDLHILVVAFTCLISSQAV